MLDQHKAHVVSSLAHALTDMLKKVLKLSKIHRRGCYHRSRCDFERSGFYLNIVFKKGFASLADFHMGHEMFVEAL